MRIGVVGLGSIASKVYLPLLCTTEAVEVVGLVSRRAETVERFGAQYRIPNRFTDLDQLLAQSPDVVFVHTPTDTHAEVVTTCLDRGAHVYVDKPLSTDIAESEAMVACAQRNNKLLAVGFNRRFAPLNRAARDWVTAPELVVATKHRTDQQRTDARQTVYDDLIHMIDLVVWLTGDPAEAVQYRQDVGADGRLLTAVGTLTGPTTTGQFAQVRRAGTTVERLELHGNGRSAQVDDLESLVLSAEGEQRVQGFGSWDTVLHRRGFAGTVNHVLSCLDSPDDCELSGERVLATHRVTEQLLSLA